MISCALRWLKPVHAPAGVRQGTARAGLLSGFLQIVLSAMLLAVLSACGEEESPLEEDGRAYIWRFQEVPLAAGAEEEAGEPEGNIRADAIFLAGDRICVIERRYGGMGQETLLFSCDFDGGTPSTVPLADADAPVPENGGVNLGSFCAGDGVLYGLESIDAWDEATGENHSSFSLVEMTLEGEVTARHALTPPAAQSPEDYYYLESMYYIGGGRLLFKDSTGLFAYDTKEERQWQVYGSPEGYFDASVTVLSDETVLIGTWSNRGYVFQEMDTAAGQLSEEIETPAEVNGYNLYPGVTHDCYYYANRSIWYFDRSSQKKGKLLDFVASDLLTDDVRGLVELPDGRLALLTAVYADRGQRPSLAVGTHVPPAEVRDREEITISCVYANSAVMRAAVAFNQESDAYRIRIADYAQYQSETDWMYPYTKLNTDIVSGHIPDILLIDEMMPVENYISKGILCDLTPFLAADEELADTELLDNIADAYRIDGKLYQMIPSFMVYTGVTQTDLLGGRKALTMRALADICAERGIAMRDSFGGMTRDELLNVLLYMQGAEYIDLETGRCAFDSPAFIELLELVKQFPEKLSDDDYQSQQVAYREGRAALMLYGFSDFEDYMRLKYGSFGGDITLVGIPGSEGSGSVILPQMQLAVTTSAKHPDAVWSFVRRFLLPDYQDGLNWGFPVRMDSMRKKVEKAQERPYYVDENGEKIEYDNTWWIGGQEVTIPQISDGEAAEVIDFLAGCDRRVYNNSTVSNIITEEAAPFFEGQKSAEEVAKIIQSRAQIYVHENR